MAGLKQSKRVSWPTDGNLCKVRLFLSEDAPSQSGLGAQDHLQAKAAWLLHAAGLAESEDSLPPGFEAPQKSHPKIETSQIPIIKWQCPPSLILNPEWVVVAGEESEELDVENRRLLGVLEAVYPRLSSIPQNPAVAPEVQATRMDDSCTPCIPITAIEDEDGMDQPDMTPANNTPMRLCGLPNAETQRNSTFEQLNLQQNAATSMPNLPHSEQPSSSLAMPTSGPAPTAEPDVLAAASAAFTAIMRSSEEGSLIDRDLLIKILSNPVMVEKLVSEYGAPNQTPLPMVSTSAAPSHQPVVNTEAVSSHQPVVNTAAVPSRQLVVTAPATSTPRPPPQIAPSAPLPAPSISHMFHAPNSVPPTALHSHHGSRPMSMAPPTQASGPPMKDANYYKSLIQLHGGDKPDTLDQNPMLFSNHGNPLDYHHNMSNGGDYHHNMSSASNGGDYHHNMSSVSNGGDSIGVGGLNQRDLKPKVPKPCAYFNTPRGCRHGSSCLFQHDSSSIPQRIEQHKGTTKRIKLDRGIAGRN